MGKKIIEKGWLYEYEETAESQITNGYEVTGVRYVLGELFDTSCNKALICIGINPSTAIPEQLDPTLKRVQQMYGVLGVILSERGNTCMTCCLEIKKKILTVLSACSMQTITSRHTKLLRKGILNTLF